MKRVTLGFSILAISAAFVVGCNKKDNVAPVADTETQSAVYASFATYIASDIEQICSFLGEDQLLNNFYIDYPGTASINTGTYTARRDTDVVIGTVKIKRLIALWNKTKCTDGFERDGTIFLDYDKNKNVPNANYTHSFGFKGEIRFSNYKVNGWLIELADPANPLIFENTLPSATFNPTLTPITWKLVGKLKLTHPSDPDKSMIWETQGLYKTLTNTDDKLVYDPKKKDAASAINYSLANVAYTGKVFGNCPRIDTTGKVIGIMAPYTMTINPNFALNRDFDCFPTVVSGVYTTTTTTPGQRTLQQHPFDKGATSFTVGTKGEFYPRQIYFGNEGNTSLLYQCDNVGSVLIKGNTYGINFIH